MEDCEEKGNGLSAVNNRKVTGINLETGQQCRCRFWNGGGSILHSEVASEGRRNDRARVDSPDGEVVGTLDIPAGDGSWKELSCEVKGLTGTHNVFLCV